MPVICPGDGGPRRFRLQAPDRIPVRRGPAYVELRHGVPPAPASLRRAGPLAGLTIVLCVAALTGIRSASAYPLNVPQPQPQDSEHTPPRPRVKPDSDVEALRARVLDTPEDHQAWQELGWTYWHRDRRDLTRVIWETWRRLQPQRSEVHTLMGRLELAENRLRPAIESFRRSLEIDPDQPDIRFELARTLRWNGNLIEAIERLRILHTEQPDKEEITLELARALSSNWNYAQALPLWTVLRANNH